MPAQLPIPREVEVLIKRGLWPDGSIPVDAQMSSPLIPRSVVRRFAPEEDTIILFPLPWQSVRALLEGDESRFWRDPKTVIHEIDPDFTLLIGDFGLGSDAPLALDYRQDINEPRVIRLRWAASGNHWVEVAPTFGAFAGFFSA